MGCRRVNDGEKLLLTALVRRLENAQGSPIVVDAWAFENAQGFELDMIRTGHMPGQITLQTRPHPQIIDAPGPDEDAAIADALDRLQNPERWVRPER